MAKNKIVASWDLGINPIYNKALVEVLTSDRLHKEFKVGETARVYFKEVAIEKSSGESFDWNKNASLYSQIMRGLGGLIEEEDHYTVEARVVRGRYVERNKDRVFDYLTKAGYLRKIPYFPFWVFWHPEHQESALIWKGPHDYYRLTKRERERWAKVDTPHIVTGQWRVNAPPFFLEQSPYKVPNKYEILRAGLYGKSKYVGCARDLPDYLDVIREDSGGKIVVINKIPVDGMIVHTVTDTHCITYVYSR
jgi:hypothetical protein